MQKASVVARAQKWLVGDQLKELLPSGYRAQVRPRYIRTSSPRSSEFDCLPSGSLSLPATTQPELARIVP
jgi:hypothetical protein